MGRVLSAVFAILLLFVSSCMIPQDGERIQARLDEWQAERVEIRAKQEAGIITIEETKAALRDAERRAKEDLDQVRKDVEIRTKETVERVTEAATNPWALGAGLLGSLLASMGAVGVNNRVRDRTRQLELKARDESIRETDAWIAELEPKVAKGQTP